MKKNQIKKDIGAFCNHYNEGDLMASMIYKVIKGDFTYKALINLFKLNNQWIKQCFNQPKYIELQLNAINELINGSGIKSFKNDISYINCGNIYNPTIAYNHYEHIWLINIYIADLINQGSD